MKVAMSTYRIHAFYILVMAVVCLLSTGRTTTNTAVTGCKASQKSSIDHKKESEQASSDESTSLSSSAKNITSEELEKLQQDRYELLKAQQQDLPQCAQGLLVNLYGSSSSSNNALEDKPLCEGFLLRDDLVVVEDPHCVNMAETVELLQPPEGYLMEHKESGRKVLGTRAIVAKEIGKAASLVTLDMPPAHHHSGWPRYRSYVQAKNETKLQAGDAMSITCLGDNRIPVIFLTDEGKEASDSILRINNVDDTKKKNNTATSTTPFLRFPDDMSRVSRLYNTLGSGERWWVVKQSLEELKAQLFARRSLYEAKTADELDIYTAKGKYALLEPEDPKHRSIHHLERYFKLWRDETPFSGEPFYQWLDFGGGRKKDYPDCPHDECLNHYKTNEFKTTQEERDNAVVEFQYGRHGEPVIVYEKDNRPVESGSMLFVWGTDGRVYVAPADKYKLHHICLTMAKPVLTAGEFRISNHGRLHDVLNDSGHYVPDDRHYIRFARFVMSKYPKLDLKDITWRKNEFSPIKEKEEWYRMFWVNVLQKNLRGSI